MGLLTFGMLESVSPLTVSALVYLEESVYEV